MRDFSGWPIDGASIGGSALALRLEIGRPMIEVMDWFRSAGLPDKPWLIVGKGPTFSQLGQADRSAHNVLGLNHVVRQTPVDVAHIIDIEVVESCGAELLHNCRYLLMPRTPHVACQASSQRLEHFVERLPVLQQLSEQGRLVWYNLATATPVGNSPPIEVRFFSAEAAVNLLGTLGVRTIRTLGIDGGRGYSSEFADLHKTTLLANGHASFDCQMDRIRDAVERFGLDFAPLYEPMRVFVGTDASQTVATRVLEYSIRQHTAQPVTVHIMDGAGLPRPRKPENRPRTAFSFARFSIPQLCGYRGRALYVDADMQVFSDVSELWQIPFDEQTILCTNQPDRPAAWKAANSGFHPGRQMSVMLLNCSRLDWRVDEIVAGLDAGRYSYEELLFKMCLLPDAAIADRIPPEWNCLEWYEAERSKLVHYTVVPTQPWKNDQNPLRGVWEACYFEAVEAGVVPLAEVVSGVDAGHLKPGLLAPFAADAVFDARRKLASQRRFGANFTRRLKTGIRRLVG